ncbi:hypothetical protein ACLOJK_003701 [Asimina triloba]
MQSLDPSSSQPIQVLGFDNLDNTLGFFGPPPTPSATLMMLFKRAPVELEVEVALAEDWEQTQALAEYLPPTSAAGFPAAILQGNGLQLTDHALNETSTSNAVKQNDVRQVPFGHIDMNMSQWPDHYPASTVTSTHYSLPPVSCIWP